MMTSGLQEVLTTGEVARLCHVAPRTVSKWFDSGQLRGYRIPGSRDRRIPLEELLNFMRANGMPLDALEGQSGLRRVLAVGPAIAPAAAQAVANDGRFELRQVGNGFEAGIIARQFRPHVVLLDAQSGPGEALAICRNIKQQADLAAAAVVAVVESDQLGSELLSGGFDACFERQSGPQSLVELLQSLDSPES